MRGIITAVRTSTPTVLARRESNHSEVNGSYVLVIFCATYSDDLDFTVSSETLRCNKYWLSSRSSFLEKILRAQLELENDRKRHRAMATLIPRVQKINPDF